MVRSKLGCGSTRDVQDEDLEGRRVQRSPGKLVSSLHRKYMEENKEVMMIVQQAEERLQAKHRNLETIELSATERNPAKFNSKQKDPVWKRRLMRIGRKTPRKLTDEDKSATDNSSTTSSCNRSERPKKTDILAVDEVVELSKQLSVKIVPSQKDTPSSRFGGAESINSSSHKKTVTKPTTVPSTPQPKQPYKKISDHRISKQKEDGGRVASPVRIPKKPIKNVDRRTMNESPTNTKTSKTHEDYSTAGSSAFMSLDSSLMSDDDGSFTDDGSYTAELTNDGSRTHRSRESDNGGGKRSNRQTKVAKTPHLPIKIPPVVRSVETFPSAMDSSSIADEMFALQTSTMYTSSTAGSTSSKILMSASIEIEDDDDDDDDSEDEGCSNVFAEDLKLFSSLFTRCRGQDQPPKLTRSRP